MRDIVREIAARLNLAFAGRYGHVLTNELIREFEDACALGDIPGFNDDKRNAELDKAQVFGDVGRAILTHREKCPEVYAE